MSRFSFPRTQRNQGFPLIIEFFFTDVEINPLPAAIGLITSVQAGKYQGSGLRS